MPAKFGPFVQVAVPTGEGEIVEFRRPAVLPRDNVFNVERTAERHLRDATILATIAGATPLLAG